MAPVLLGAQHRETGRARVKVRGREAAAKAGSKDQYRPSIPLQNMRNNIQEDEAVKHPLVTLSRHAAGGLGVFAQLR